MSFEEEDIEWKCLGEVAEINTGQKPFEILDNITEFYYINAGTSNSGYCEASNSFCDVITTLSRGQGGIGYIAYQEKPFWLGPLCYKIFSTDQNIILNKYIYYYLFSKNELILSLKKVGGVPAINKSDLEKLKISVPKIDVQKDLTKMLDNFYVLVGSNSDGLSREIDLCQQQFKYYRDLFFSFS